MPNYIATVNCVETVPIYAPLQCLHVEVTGSQTLLWWCSLSDFECQPK